MQAAYTGVEAWPRLWWVPSHSTGYLLFALRDISRGLPPFASRHSRNLLSGTVCRVRVKISTVISPKPLSCSRTCFRALNALTEAIEEDWAYFTGDLERSLGKLEKDEFLISSLHTKNYYVQFASGGEEGIRAEATGNVNTLPGQTLSLEACETMEQFGWNPPKKGPEGSPNYFLNLEVPVDCEFLAVVSVGTLRCVFETLHPLELEYKSFQRDGTPIVFGDMCIPRRGEDRKQWIESSNLSI